MGAPGGRQDLAGWVRGRVTAEPTWVRTLVRLPHKESHTSVRDRDCSSGVSEEHVLQQKQQSPGGSARRGGPAQWVSFPFLVTLARQQPLQCQAHVVGPQFSRGKDRPTRTAEGRLPGPLLLGQVHAPRRADLQVPVPAGTQWSPQSWGFRMSGGTGQRSPAWSPPHAARSPPRPVHVGKQGFTVSVRKPERVGAFRGDYLARSSSSGNGQLFPARALPVAEGECSLS